ncbi:hypothetical protein quinque_008574 [Culex quinquefasciatus]
MAPNLVQMMWHSSLTALCLMDHVVGLLPVKFDRIAEGRRRCRTGTRITRPLVTALVVLCLTLLASYEWTSVLLADGIDQKYLKQWISLAVMWVLNLFVALVIYWRQLVNSGQIQSLNDSFALLASQHSANTGAFRNPPLRHLATVLALESVGLAGLWLVINPMYRSYSAYDGFLSVVLMAPVTVCSLTAVRYCVNFSSINCILANLNRDTGDRVRHFRRRMLRVRENISGKANELAIAQLELELSNHLDRLIIHYDMLGETVAAIIEMYSPSILFLVTLDIGQVTFQLYMFYCYLSRSSPSGDDGGEHLHNVASTLVSALLSFLEIVLIVDGTAKFAEGTDDCIELLQRIGIHFNTEILEQNISVLCELLHHTQEATIRFYCFAMDRSFLMTIIAAACSYLILLMQTA